ncbi:hypothetical protein [Paenisporosarcina sp.]|uniref:hypothetical protein n=1 Tax=Paenisporosarcina sp. TaxID=1932001 RepID=UPI003C7143C5
MKRWWFWGALMLIAVAWAINIAIYETEQLEEPIVLKHYIELPMEQTHFFKIYYLTNKNNPAILQSLEVNGLSIPNISSSNDMWLYGNENSIYNTPNIVQEFTHHLLLEGHFDHSMLSPEGVEDKPFTWNNVILSFGDSTIKEYNIGEIHFNSSRVKEEHKLSSMSSGGTSNGLHSTIYVAEEQLKMDEVIVPIYITQDVQVKVHYEGEKARVPDAVYQAGNMPDWDDVSQPLAKDIDWPISLEPQGTVGLYVQIDPTLTTAIDARIDWEGKTVDGQKVIAPVSLQHIPQLTTESLHQMIKKAGETQ